LDFACAPVDQFLITPRLVLLSSVRGCGKTTVLDLIDILNLEAYRTDNVGLLSPRNVPAPCG
jgi:hypothetical protein